MIDNNGVPPIPPPPPTPSGTPDWALELFQGVKRIEGMVGDLHDWKETVEQRLQRNSEGVKAGSKANFDQDSLIAQMKIAQDSQGKKIDAMYNVVTGTLQNPKVLWAGRILFMALAAWAAQKGIKVLP